MSSPFAPVWVILPNQDHVRVFRHCLAKRGALGVELAYTVAGDTDIIDLLYRASQNWIVADFKSGEVRDPAQLAERVRAEGYDKQLGRYARALAAQLASCPRTMLVLLDVARQVQVWAPYPTVARPAARW